MHSVLGSLNIKAVWTNDIMILKLWWWSHNSHSDLTHTHTSCINKSDLQHMLVRLVSDLRLVSAGMLWLVVACFLTPVSDFTLSSRRHQHFNFELDPQLLHILFISLVSKWRCQNIWHRVVCPDWWGRRKNSGSVLHSSLLVSLSPLSYSSLFLLLLLLSLLCSVRIGVFPGARLWPGAC